MGSRMIIIAGLVAGALLGLRPAAAEVSEVRFAQQVSMTYLQFNVMAHESLVEKHAAMTPVGVQHYADFMHKTGRLSVAPKSWKDMFFDDIHDLDGS
jgi:hypothetical protein